MKRYLPITVLAVCSTLAIAAGSSFAQQDQASVDRKVVERVMPQYPAMGRTLRLSGSVRVDVLVMPNGTVKSLQVKGGHPLLAAAAADAVRRWKWVPAKIETKEPIIVTFDPDK